MMPMIHLHVQGWCQLSDALDRLSLGHPDASFLLLEPDCHGLGGGGCQAKNGFLSGGRLQKLVNTPMMFLPCW